MLAKLIRWLLFCFDVNKGFAFEAASLPAAMRRARRRGTRANTVIDIGASNGQWSREVRQFFPGADYLLIEAQEIHRPALESYAAQDKQVHVVVKAAGERRGEVLFDADDPFSGQAVQSPRDGLTRVPMTTIDSEIAARSLKGPYLIKFDVHGYELPILEGARETLKECSLVVMECYNFKIGESALLFHDMCKHMETLGFRVIDFSEPLWRPCDEALWQMDFFFIPVTGPEFASSSYR